MCGIGALRGQAVNVGGLHAGVASITEGLCAPLVAEDEDDIG